MCYPWIGADSHSPQGPKFDLSWLKVLRHLEVGAWVTDSSPADRCNTVVAEVFSTITSPVFSDLVVVVAGHANYLRQEVKLFDTLRMMNDVRPFKLVFLLEGPSPSQWEVWQLEGILKSLTAKGLLDFLNSPPSVRISERVPLWGRLVLIVGMKVQQC